MTARQKLSARDPSVAQGYLLYGADGRVIAVVRSELASFAARRLLRPDPS